MYDSTKVLVGLGIFVVLFGYPFWSNLGGSYKAPELEKAKKEPCVEDPAWMRANHMQLLDEWRHASTRDGKRQYVSKTNGKVWEASLQKTCMDCHASQEKFCTACHEANSVHPYCWTCHVTPETGADAKAAPAKAGHGAKDDGHAKKDDHGKKKEKGHE